MKRRSFIIGVAVVVALASLSTVYAQRSVGRSGRAQMRRPAMAALDLTAEQRSQMQALRSAHTKAAAPLKADVVVARTELQELMRQKSPDAGAVRKAVDKVSKAQGKVLLARTEHRVAVNNILTDEQRAKLSERKAWRGKRGGRKGGRRGGDGMHGRQGMGRGMGRGMGADVSPHFDAPIGA